jgi:hypothetical protein
MAKPMDYAKVGAVMGALGGIILGLISKLVSMIPGISLDLQSISVSTTGLGSVVNTGLSKYAQKLLGLVPISLGGMDWLYLAAGGAASLVLGAYAVENVKQLQFAKTKEGRLATIFVIAGLATGAILSMSINVPTISGMIIMAIDAYILSWIAIYLDNMTGLKLIP